MTRFTSILSGVVLAAVVGANGAMAANAPAKVAKVHSPESIACSQQADAKGLHGKERKSFRSTCKSQMRAANTAAKKPSTAPTAPATDKKS
ncbi:MAG: phosphate starvation-inducible protein PsiF [Hyphomicrobium sp.]|nr:phosphate starvation-inducible protein PsiF [Hyphomicrobium sp.]